jgi:hypothetical protein
VFILSAWQPKVAEPVTVSHRLIYLILPFVNLHPRKMSWLWRQEGLRRVRPLEGKKISLSIAADFRSWRVASICTLR